MKLVTERFGEIEVDQNFVFDFVEPILGYEQLNKFVLIDHNPESAFKWLQAIEDGSVAFPVSFPKLFGIDYEFVIPETEAKLLGLTNIEDLLAFNIVCIPQGQPQDATINLSAPIIMNLSSKKAIQLVLLESSYPVRHKLFNNAIQKPTNEPQGESKDKKETQQKTKTKKDNKEKDSTPVNS